MFKTSHRTAGWIATGGRGPAMVIHLAQKLLAEVTLVHVVERNTPKEIHGEPHLSDRRRPPPI